MPINILIAVTILTLVIIGSTTTIRVRRRRNLDDEEDGGYSATEISWEKSIKHTIVLYLVPTLILALPFLAGSKPTMNDVMQAATVFLAISYLKNIYW